MARHAVRSLWSGDNLDGLAGLDDESVALAYLDPPFNSGRPYEAIVSRSWTPGSEAFRDQWRWDERSELGLRELDQEVPRPVSDLVRGLVATLGRSDVAAYLVMMAPRLVAIHRVLASSGSIYLHCDPTASHYLKILLDHIFGAENFRNEIVWKRTHAHSSSRRYGPVHTGSCAMMWSRFGPMLTSSDRKHQFAPMAQPPVPSSSAASAVMRGNRGRDTRPELALRSELHRQGLRFRTHFRAVPDLPFIVDIAFPRQRVAVSLDGCIWHGCPEHGMRPRTNAAYWRAKIKSNVARDRRTDQALADAGWRTVRVWEHESAQLAAERIRQIIASEREPGSG